MEKKKQAQVTRLILALLLEAQVTLLCDRELDTTAARHRDPTLLVVTNHEHVAETS